MLYCCFATASYAQTAPKSVLIVEAGETARLIPSGSPAAETWFNTHISVLMDNKNKRLGVAFKQKANGSIKLRVVDKAGVEVDKTTLGCTPAIYWETPFNYAKEQYVVEASFTVAGTSTGPLHTASYTFRCK